MIEKQASRFQQTPGGLKKGVQKRKGMLHRSHRGDLVEPAGSGEVPEIGPFHPALGSQTPFLNFCAGVFVLRPAEGDAESVDPVMLRGVENQSAPAAPDIQKRFSRLQHQLAADVIQLVPLGVVDVLLPRVKIAAGVLQGIVQHLFPEGNRQIIMKADRLADALPLAGLSVRRDRGMALVSLVGGRQGQQPFGEMNLLPPGDVQAGKIVLKLERHFQVAFDIEILEHVRLRQPQLRRVPQQFAERARMIDHQGEPTGLPHLLRQGAAVPEANGKITR